MRLYGRTVVAALVAVTGIVFLLTAYGNGSSGEAAERLRPASCPPFFLRDDYGLIIDPVADPETAAAYSPRRTCGACHDYNRITDGYHFQMGADILTDDFGGKDKPWTLSDGPFGKFDLTYNRQLAPKDIPSPSHADMGVYEWVMECGICHPGGARAERDRNDHRYDDLQTTDSELAQLLDGDYYGARWDESGVIEADCLICHLGEGYNYGIRVGQMLKGNFRWAATAAAGLGGIAGSVRDNEVPRVHYNARLFNVDGKIDLPITRPDDRSCTHCHDQSGYEKTGTTWGDHYNEGVHTKSGIRCIDCHPGDLDHNFAKGDTNNLTLRDDLDGSMRVCEDCHATGDLGAPEMVHRGLPQVHLDMIACETCHIPYKKIAAKNVIDYSTGTTFTSPVPDTAKAAGDVAEWTPTYTRDDDGKIRPYNMLLPVWWGHKEGDLIHPLFPKEVKAVFDQMVMKAVEDSKPKKVTPEIIRRREQALFAEFDDNGDGKPEINTSDEIAAIASALKETLRGKRFADPNPVLVKGLKVFEANTDGTVKSYFHKQSGPVLWALEHNVAPRGEALGAGGCDDCHASESPFFFAAATINPYGEDGKPVTLPMHKMMGISASSVFSSARREGLLKPAAPWIVLGVVLVIVLHFCLFGTRGDGKEYVPNVVRFRLHERLTHLVLMLSVVYLAVTGFFFLLGENDPLGQGARDLHGIIGYVGGGALLLALLFWLRAIIPAKGDVRWLFGLGGYFGGNQELPAGKFNAGQKIFAYIVILLGLVLVATGILMYFYKGTHHPRTAFLYAVHDLAGLLIILLLLAHIYLGAVVNPHSLRSLFGGKVSDKWAKEHHPDWKLPAKRDPKK